MSPDVDQLELEKSLPKTDMALAEKVPADQCLNHIAGTVISDAHYQLLRQHGRHTLSYSLFQPGMSHFASAKGLVAYEKHFLTTLVLGDPLASRDDSGTVLDSFLAAHASSFFCAIGRETAMLLQDRGFRINRYGSDVRIPIQTYSLSDKPRLRSFKNALARSGYTVKEYQKNDPALDIAAETISVKWRESRTVSDKEIRFLQRPIVYGFEADVRKFFVEDQNNEPVAFFYFDPLYEGGRVIGYTTAFKRQQPDLMNGLEQAVTLLAIDVFRAEGKTWLHLGAMPLHGVDLPSEFRGSYTLTKDLINTRRYGDGIVFNFSGQEKFKRSFGGEEFPLFFATRYELNPLSLLALRSTSNLTQSWWQIVLMMYQLYRAMWQA